MTTFGNRRTFRGRFEARKSGSRSAYRSASWSALEGELGALRARPDQAKRLGQAGVPGWPVAGKHPRGVDVVEPGQRGAGLSGFEGERCEVWSALSSQDVSGCERIAHVSGALLVTPISALQAYLTNTASTEGT